ncbi:spermidine synthase [Microbacterium suaedae]|uniref:spermidine synthase n=1 Tax=Microbacterium suaedae TaxID=2067813 RepID=UPI000DA1D8F6|nr:fused MFS/spermidine synthase [Microbacterium suaedae]
MASDTRREALALSGEREAVLVRDDTGWRLEVDGVLQSHVAPAGEPARLASARWMIAAIGPGSPLRVAHLGGGLLTLPRLVADVRPGSAQLVLEIEPAYVALAGTRLPAPDGVEVREADARDWLDGADPAAWDAVTVDVFAGGRIPPRFTSIESVRAARRALADDGVLVINSTAGPELDFTRRQLAGLRTVFRHVALIVQGSSLGGLRFGNACMIASDAPLPADRIRSALRGDPSRGALVTDLDELVGDADPLSEREGLWSPTPALPDASGALEALEHMRRTLEGMLPPDRA